MKIAVALLLYQRPEHSVRVIESLVQNGVEHCYAFMDGSDSEEVAIKQDVMAEYIAQHNGISMDLIRSPERKGLAKSVTNAVSTVLEENEAVVLLEDDCVLQPMSMRFFSEGLQQLHGDRSVRSLCGYLYPVQSLAWNGNPELIKLKRFSPWGWATWKDRWQEYDTDLRGLVQQLEQAGINLEDYAEDVAALCRQDAFLDGQKDIWSLNWTVLHYLTDTYSVYPRESLIENIGLDGSGQNCVPTNEFSSTGNIFGLIERTWDNLEYDESNEEKVKHFMDEHGLKLFPDK